MDKSDYIAATFFKTKNSASGIVKLQATSSIYSCLVEWPTCYENLALWIKGAV